MTFLSGDEKTHKCLTTQILSDTLCAKSGALGNELIVQLSQVRKSFDCLLRIFFSWEFCSLGSEVMFEEVTVVCQKEQ